tara:strand:- start:5032 stop:5412 length:381 start_codon:yes stop_codon:yes gene_type:complete
MDTKKKFEKILLERENTLHIDVMELMNLRKSGLVEDKFLIDMIEMRVKDKNILDINVGKKFTIYTLERSIFFIRDMAKMFYSLDDLNIESCKLRNIPSCFKTMFKFVKPLLCKHALDVLEIEQIKK